MNHDVFISYSSYDKQIADAICSKLENSNIRCWIAPRDILGGMEYGEAIIDAIGDCSIIVLVFSANANNSIFVRKEIERALSKGKIIIPFRIENILPTKAMEFALGNTHWLDAMTPPLESHITTLVITIHRLLNTEESILVPIKTDKEILPIEKKKLSWLMKTTIGPGKRSDFAMVYNNKIEGIILHGGFGSGNNDDLPFSQRRGPDWSDTWVWDGKSWQVIEEYSLGLQSHTLAYNKSTKQCVIYGGNTGGLLHLPNRDTYFFDVKSWIKVNTNYDLGPKKRSHHTMAYDGKRETIMLFGGYTIAPGVHSTLKSTIVSGETWEFNGSAWEKFHVKGPEPRCGHQMVYDEGNGVIVLFGGHSESNFFNDTWIWEGNTATWSKIASENMPSARCSHAMTYDRVRKKVLLFGGQSDSKVPLNDLWEWDENDWKLLIEHAPPKPRYNHGFVYDEKRNKSILFGGFDGKEWFQDTWEFTY